MPTYRVRMNAGDKPDEGEPLDFCDDEAATRDAQIAVAEAAREAIPGQDKAHIDVEIDNEQVKPVYRAELDFKGRNGEPEPERYTADELPVGPRD